MSRQVTLAIERPGDGVPGQPKTRVVLISPEGWISQTSAVLDGRRDS
jgi:hypothetical protein